MVLLIYIHKTNVDHIVSISLMTKNKQNLQKVLYEKYLDTREMGNARPEILIVLKVYYYTFIYIIHVAIAA